MSWTCSHQFLPQITASSNPLIASHFRFLSAAVSPATSLRSAFPPSSLQSALPPSTLQSALPPSALQSTLPPSSLHSALPPSYLHSALPPSSLQFYLTYLLGQRIFCRSLCVLVILTFFVSLSIFCYNLISIAFTFARVPLVRAQDSH